MDVKIRHHSLHSNYYCARSGHQAVRVAVRLRHYYHIVSDVENTTTFLAITSYR